MRLLFRWLESDSIFVVNLFVSHGHLEDAELEVAEAAPEVDPVNVSLEGVEAGKLEVAHCAVWPVHHVCH